MEMNQYATHQQVLVKAVLNTQGPIIELGCGWYSTPILHELALYSNRVLFTFDNNLEWLEHFKHFGSSNHIVEFSNWKDIVFRYHLGVVFVDTAPGPEREYLVDQFRGSTDVLVLHDTEEQVQYGWQRVLPTFKYQYTDKTQPTWTTLASDKIDVRTWL